MSSVHSSFLMRSRIWLIKWTRFIYRYWHLYFNFSLKQLPHLLVIFIEYWAFWSIILLKEACIINCLNYVSVVTIISVLLHTRVLVVRRKNNIKILLFFTLVCFGWCCALIDAVCVSNSFYPLVYLWIEIAYYRFCLLFVNPLNIWYSRKERTHGNICSFLLQ